MQMYILCLNTKPSVTYNFPLRSGLHISVFTFKWHGTQKKKTNSRDDFYIFWLDSIIKTFFILIFMVLITFVFSKHIIRNLYVKYILASVIWEYIWDVNLTNSNLGFPLMSKKYHKMFFVKTNDCSMICLKSI